MGAGALLKKPRRMWMSDVRKWRMLTSRWRKHQECKTQTNQPAKHILLHFNSSQKNIKNGRNKTMSTQGQRIGTASRELALETANQGSILSRTNTLLPAPPRVIPKNRVRSKPGAPANVVPKKIQEYREHWIYINSDHFYRRTRKNAQCSQLY